MRSVVAASVLGLMALTGAGPAIARGEASDAAPYFTRVDVDDDRRGRERDRNGGAAQYIPLESIIGQIQARTPGRLVGVRGPNGGIYRIIWETPDGRVVTFVVDARTGQILR